MKITKYDLFLELFPHCNLGCTFCQQRECRNYKVNYDSIVRLPKSFYVRQCLKQIKANGIEARSLSMMGGEMFYDNSNEYVSSVRELLSYLHPCVVNVTTNLVFDLNHSDLFQYLLCFPGFSISCSYNPINRYTSEKQAQLFIHNVKTLYEEFYERGHKLSVEIVLQPEILLGEVDLSFLDYLRTVHTVLGHCIDVTFLVDYRGYSKELLDNFNSLLLSFLTKYPIFTNVLCSYDTSHTSKFCVCLQEGTTCLSYNNGFQFSTKPVSCIDHELTVTEAVKRLESCYHCSSCPYEKYCKDVCVAALEKSGLLRPEQYCYHRFIFDSYSRLVKGV